MYLSIRWEFIYHKNVDKSIIYTGLDINFFPVFPFGQVAIKLNFSCYLVSLSYDSCSQDFARARIWYDYYSNFMTSRWCYNVYSWQGYEHFSFVTIFYVCWTKMFLVLITEGLSADNLNFIFVVKLTIH